MTAVLSKRPHERFTPDSYQGADGAPVYLVAKLAWKERARFRQRMVSEGVRYPDDVELARAVSEAVRAIAPSNAAELQADIQAFLDARDAPPLAEPASPSDTETKKVRAARQAEQVEIEVERARRLAALATYNAVLDAMRGHPAVGQLLGFRVAFNEMLGPICAAYVLRGWENVEAPFRRIGEVVPDEVLEQIPEEDMRAIGLYGLSLMTVTPAQRGN